MVILHKGPVEPTVESSTSEFEDAGELIQVLSRALLLALPPREVYQALCRACSEVPSVLSHPSSTQANQQEHQSTIARRADRRLRSNTDKANIPIELTRSRILDTAEAAGLCGFSVAHWRRLYRGGKVPKPIQLSARKLGWRAGDLIDWLQARLDSS